VVDLQSTAVSTNLTIEQALQLKRNAFNAQVMFSNLGRLPFDSAFGPLKIETLWAPSALRGIEGEQTLGAVTVNGSLHLTHTSPAPIRGLLAGIEEELRKACANLPGSQTSKLMRSSAPKYRDFRASHAATAVHQRYTVN
jgi:hypothetical protein